MKSVLAIDGGGMRGIIPATVLSYVEEKTGKPVGQVFDYICGSSTGGLVALAMAKENPPSAKALLDVYQDSGPKIFSSSITWKVRNLGQLAGPKYNNAELFKATQGILGEQKMSQAATPCMVTTYDLSTRQTTFISSYNTPDDMMMTDAAMMTTAGPTYFAPWKNCIDGGTVDNNPALSGSIEASRLFNCSVEDLLVLSLGTGSSAQPYDGKAAAGWGLLSWATPLVSIFSDGTSDLHEYHLNRLLPIDNILRLQTILCGDMADMDNATGQNIALLQERGRSVVAENKDCLDAFIERLMKKS